MRTELGKLFGSVARLKLLRLFLFNQEVFFDRDDILRRSQVTRDMLTRELTALKNAKIVKVRKRNGRAVAWSANEKFPYREELTQFLMQTIVREHDEVLKDLRGVGTLKAVILSGLFTGAVESPVDIFIIGDRIKQQALGRTMHKLEGIIGRELRYTVLPAGEFVYRKRISDRTVRNIFDYPHLILLDKIGL